MLVKLEYSVQQFAFFWGGGQEVLIKIKFWNVSIFKIFKPEETNG